jgi:hypothetical protein
MPREVNIYSLPGIQRGIPMNDYLVIFGRINADGTLLKLSPADAYELALQHVRPGQIYETYEIARADSIRRFAKNHLVGLDRARFLCYASVSVVERPYAREFASLAVNDAMEALYGGDDDELYGDGGGEVCEGSDIYGPFEEDEDVRIARLYSAAAVPPIPSATDLILDHDFA